MLRMLLIAAVFICAGCTPPQKSTSVALENQIPVMVDRSEHANPGIVTIDAREIPGKILVHARMSRMTYTPMMHRHEVRVSAVAPDGSVRIRGKAQLNTKRMARRRSQQTAISIILPGVLLPGEKLVATVAHPTDD